MLDTFKSVHVGEGAKSNILIIVARELWVGPQTCVISVQRTYVHRGFDPAVATRSSHADPWWMRSDNFQHIRY